MVPEPGGQAGGTAGAAAGRGAEASTGKQFMEERMAKVLQSGENRQRRQQERKEKYHVDPSKARLRKLPQDWDK